MTASRQKILTHLRKTRSASAREIARALKLSAPNVRHHLSVLCSDGRVEMAAIQRSREGRGRPEKVYSLSEAALGDNLPALTKALLAEADSRLRVDALAEHILDVTPFVNLAIPKRLALLVETLNAMHYQARWEAGADGPRVMFGRCPYAKVIDGHPEICKVDLAILELAMGRPISTVQKNQAAVGFCPFVFRIGA